MNEICVESANKHEVKIMNRKILAIIACIAMLISSLSALTYAAKEIEVEIDLGGLFDDEPVEDPKEDEKEDGDNKDDNKGSNKGNNTPSTNGKTETKEEYKDVDLLKAIDALYEGIAEENMPMVMSMPLEDAESFTNFTFLPYSADLEAVVSEPMIGAVAHSVVLVECKDASTAARVAFEMVTNCNPRKWICVGADNVKAVSGGNVAMLLMTTVEGGLGETILKNFEKQFGIDNTYEYGAEEEWENPFTDVKDTDWFYDTVKYVNQNGIINGMTADTFAPGTTLTRAMLVTILYRAEGSPEVESDSKFSDVKASEWFGAPVIWAAENGIVNGVSEAEFAPNNAITREQIAAIMYRYAQAKEYDVAIAKVTVIDGYEDVSSVSSWAVDAIKYTVGTGIMKGKTETTINPQDKATRAEAATVVMRFIEGNK